MDNPFLVLYWPWLLVKGLVVEDYWAEVKAICGGLWSLGKSGFRRLFLTFRGLAVPPIPLAELLFCKSFGSFRQ